MKMHVCEFQCHRCGWDSGICLRTLWRQPCLYLLLFLVFASPVFAQQVSLPGAGQRQLTPAEKVDAAAIMDLSKKIEDATVRGDVAYVDSVASPDFIMIH